MRYYIVLALIVLFANSVTIKYAEEVPHFTPFTRYLMAIERRPALPLISYMNTHLTDDHILYQNGYDEYRAWIDPAHVGRHLYVTSWNRYSHEYPHNSPADLELWMQTFGATHFMIHPSEPWELPGDDPDFWRKFGIVAYTDNHMLFQLGPVMEDPVNVNPIPEGIGYPQWDMVLQE